MKITKLKHNITKYFILTVFLIMSLICGIIILSSYFAMKNTIESNINSVYKQTLLNSEEIGAERLPKSFYFKVDKNGKIVSSEADGEFIDEKKIEDMLHSVMEGKTDLIYKNINYKVFEEEEYDVYVFVDSTSEMTSFNNTIFISTLTCISSFILISSFSFIIAKWVVKPYEESYEKEKKFLTNASHELKTPLTIISSNNDLIVKEFGENEYSESTDHQINRMVKLINEMISLNKINETYIKEEDFTSFSLTELVYEAITPYINIFKEKDIKFNYDIAEDVEYKGSEENIFKLFSILLDNINKYIGGRKEINFTLTTFKKKIKITLANSVDELNEEKLLHVFDRFYTGEESHNSSKSGFGIGLSLAKEIVELHKGKIEAKTNENKDFIIEIEL